MQPPYGNSGYQQGPPQPQYSQPPPNYNTPQNYGQNYGAPQGQGFNGGKETFNETFKLDRPKYNDLWASILFLLTFLGFVAVSGISLHGYATNSSGGGIYQDANSFTINSNTMILFAFVLIVAFALSWLYLILARLFTKQFIWATGILNIVLGFGTAIYYLYRKQYGAGIVFLIFAAFTVFCFITWIPRIPFSVLMLQTSVDVARGYGHVFLVSALGGLAALVFAAWYSVTLAAIYVRYAPQSNSCSSDSTSCSWGTVIGLVVFITFAGYWISEVLKNVIYTTIAGVYGSWFFCYSDSAPTSSLPKGATRGSFRRATTYSFGSISFGSLIVALINCLRQIVSVAQNQEAGQGNAAAACALCILGCLISILQSIAEFINRYAFSHIALYGKPYLAAAKDTWKMMKDRGIDALVNDCLIGPVLSMGSVFVGFACALLAFLYLEFTNPPYNSGGGFFAVIMAFSFLIGLQVCQIFMTPLGAGVDTIFVASAWDPEVLIKGHERLYAEMIRVYPRVQERIHA